MTMTAASGSGGFCLFDFFLGEMRLFLLALTFRNRKKKKSDHDKFLRPHGSFLSDLGDEKFDDIFIRDKRPTV